MINKIPDYNTNLELLMQQWKNSDNLKAITSGAMDQANKMEDAIFEVRDLMYLDSAVGITLDILGKPWNESRENRSDDDYRIAIKQKKLEYYSGEPEAIIEILKASFGASFVKYYPEYPGKYILVTDASSTQEEQDEISMAGITGFKGGFLIDQEGNYIIEFGGFETGNIVDQAGNYIIDFDGGVLQHVISSISAGKILHVDN